ncbi:hypothetical protein DEI93_07110 [Curtobacterium sp. MCBD17_035]|uniref:hypothetical protein n=1 Tax=Curtobacterium sp. MCBD17_035 TaxID=2175673 RepID=UPI000DA8B8B2|nr:hypothetical protein [Curtobacterium sp. MCBD17_035]WIB68790.1 hypothetical protein DEI93_07110 [Curtobacterium sp. MCBD17_035]
MPDAVEEYLLHLLADLMTGTVGLDQMPAAVAALLMWGNQPLRDRIDQLQHECDRLYGEVARRTPPVQALPEPFAEVQERRRQMYAVGGAA